MFENNGWSEFTKTSRDGYLEKYRNQIVIVVGKGKNKNIYITDAVWETLGKSEYIKVLTRGSNIAFVKCDNDVGFKVQHNHNSSLVHISGVSLCNAYQLKSGAYDAHIETGKVVFDARQSPAIA